MTPRQAHVLRNRMYPPLPHFGASERNGWWIGVNFFWMWRFVGRGIAIGWGWDDDLPLRPWPALAPASDRSDGGGCLGCCGLFVTYNWRDMHREVGI